MSLASEVSALATRIATEIKAVRGEASGTLRRIGVARITATSGNITSEANQGTVTIPGAVVGRIYRVIATAHPRNATAGAYTILALKYGVNAGIGGTQFQAGFKDHRMAGRPEAVTIVGEFTWDGTPGANVNVVLVLSAGSGTTVNENVATRHTILIVDEVLP